MSTRSPASASQSDNSGWSYSTEEKTEATEGTVWTSDDSDDTGSDMDLDMPLHWPKSRKMITLGLIASSTFNDAIISSILAPAVSQVLEDFNHNDPVLGSLIVSVHVIGYVAGPLVLAPLSEIYGRSPLIHASNALFVLSSVLSALSINIPMMMVSRVLMGVAGCIPNTLGGAVIADMMPVEERGMAISFWASGLLMGSVAGPIIGGYMAMNVGWRWTFWFGSILTGCVAIACLLFFHETYLPVLRQHRPTSPDTDRPPPRHLIWKAVFRPAKLLTRSPVVVIASLYSSVAYVYLYFLLTAFPRLFGQHYDFNLGQIGLAYIGLGVGFCIAQCTVGPLSDWNIRRQQTKRGFTRPEDRLPPLLIGCCSMAIGMICFGWTAQAHVHWIVPIISTVPVGIADAYHLIAVDLYLVDAFTTYSASAMAVNVVIRSLLAALMPLVAPALYGDLGYGWGNTCLGLIELVMAPTALLLYRYGEAIRTYPKFQVAL